MHAKTIGLIAHTGKPGVAELINAIAQEFDSFSISTLFEKETAQIAGKKSGLSLAELGAAADLLGRSWRRRNDSACGWATWRNH